MDNYIEKSVEFRMGKWYDKKFKSNEFDWNDIQEKNYISRESNIRWKLWIECFKNLGITKNPGIILDSNDMFIYEDFVKRNIDYKCPLKNLFKIPVATHNRQANSKNSILFPLRHPTLDDITNKFVDSYNFSEKKNEIIWRGKFTGHSDSNTIEFCRDIEKNINKYHRFKCVQMWCNTHNIKFVENYSVIQGHENRKKFDNMLYNPIVQKNLLYLEKMFQENKDMIGSFIKFRTEMIQYKYILNLDGHDSSSAIINILKSNSLMISPIPKWHIVVNFKLEPWVHYVPLKDDTSDLEEKLKWCNSNQEKCEEIVKNASEYISQFNEKSEQEIEKRIFEKLYENGD